MIPDAFKPKPYTARYFSEILKRDCDYYIEDDSIIPDLSADECLLEEDIIEEIKGI